MNRIFRTVRRFAAVSMASAYALSMLLSPTVVSAANIGGRPANPDPKNERTKSIFVKELKPGQVAKDTVEVVNNSDEAKKVTVYAVDVSPSSGGAFACAQAADKRTGVGSWITVDVGNLEIPAGQNKKVDFTITVPANASVGEQNGCIALQEEQTASVQSGIGLTFRTAIRVAILIPGKISKQITPAGLLAIQGDGKIVLTPQVRNSGNVSVDARIDTRIRGLFGGTISTQSSTYPVLREQTAEWNFDHKKPFWGGFYKASFSVSYDESTKQYIGDKPERPKTVTGPSRLVFVMPAPVGMLVELLVLMGIGLLIALAVRRKRQSTAVRTSWVAYAVQEGDNIEDIAEDHDIGWKQLAAINQLKPPYRLKPGQRLKVPSRRRHASR